MAATLGRSLSLADLALLNTLLDLLRALPEIDWLILLLLDYYPDLERAGGTLTRSIAQKGLGKRGCYPISPDIWHSCVPADLMERMRAFLGHRDPSPSCRPMV